MSALSSMLKAFLPMQERKGSEEMKDNGNLVEGLILLVPPAIVFTIYLILELSGKM